MKCGLLAVGYSKQGIWRRIQAGVLFRVHRGVTAVAGTRETFDFRGDGGRSGLRRIRYDLPEVISGRVAPRIDGRDGPVRCRLPGADLAFEADGDAFHKGRLDRMRDEARDEQCARLGWTVRRFSTEDIRLRPAGTADEVARLRRGAGAT